MREKLCDTFGSYLMYILCLNFPLDWVCNSIRLTNMRSMQLSKEILFLSPNFFVGSIQYPMWTFLSATRKLCSMRKDINSYCKTTPSSTFSFAILRPLFFAAAAVATMKNWRQARCQAVTKLTNQHKTSLYSFFEAVVTKVCHNTRSLSYLDNEECFLACSNHSFQLMLRTP